MTEEKSHFRIKNGETEIEYYGPLSDTNQRYEEAFEWLKGIPAPETPTKNAKTRVETVRKSTRGPEIWSSAIDELIKQGYFKRPNQRKTKDVLKALADKAFPVEDKGDTITTTLRRKIRKGDLKGTKGPDGWTFWTD